MNNNFQFNTSNNPKSGYTPIFDNNVSYIPSNNKPRTIALPSTGNINPVTADYSGGGVNLLKVETIPSQDELTGTNYTNNVSVAYDPKIIDFYSNMGFSNETIIAHLSNLSQTELEEELGKAQTILQRYNDNPEFYVSPDGSDFDKRVLFPELYKIEVIDKMPQSFQIDFNNLVTQVVMNDHLPYEEALYFVTYNFYQSEDRIKVMLEEYEVDPEEEAKKEFVYNYFISMGESEEHAFRYSLDYEKYYEAALNAESLCKCYINFGYHEDIVKKYVYGVCAQDFENGTNQVSVLLESAKNVMLPVIPRSLSDLNPDLHNLQMEHDSEVKEINNMISTMVSTGKVTEEEAKAYFSKYSHDELLAIARGSGNQLKVDLTYDSIYKKAESQYTYAYADMRKMYSDDITELRNEKTNSSTLSWWISNLPGGITGAMEYILKNDISKDLKDPEDIDLYNRIVSTVTYYYNYEKSLMPSFINIEYENCILEENKDEYDLYFGAYASTAGFDEDFEKFNKNLYQEYLDKNPVEVLSYEDWKNINYVNNFNLFYVICFDDWKIARYGDKVTETQTFFNGQMTVHKTDGSATKNLKIVVKDEELFERAHKFLEDSELATFNYIYTTRGEDAALDYIKTFEEELKRREGYAASTLFLEPLNGSGSDYVYIGLSGFVEGVIKFFTNIPKLFTADAELEPEDYEMMYIMNELATNPEYAPYLDMVYEIAESLGFMAIPTVIAVATTVCTSGSGSGAAVSTYSTFQQIMIATNVAGQVAMGVSVAGGNYEYALESGADKKSSYMYGISTGVMAIMLEKLLGSIPGIGKSKGFFLNLLSEVGEEELEEFIDGQLKYSLLNQENAIIEATDVENLTRVGICALVCSGIFSTGNAVIQGTVVTVSDMEFIATLDNPGQYFASVLRSNVTGENFADALKNHDPQMYQKYVEYQNSTGGNTNDIVNQDMKQTNLETTVPGGEIDTSSVPQVPFDPSNITDIFKMQFNIATNPGNIDQVRSYNDYVTYNFDYGVDVDIVEDGKTFTVGIIDDANLENNKNVLMASINSGDYGKVCYDAFVNIDNINSQLLMEIFNGLSVEDQSSLMKLCYDNGNVKLASKYYQIAKFFAQIDIETKVPVSQIKVAFLADDYSVNGVTDLQARETMYNFEQAFTESDPKCVQAIVKDAYDQFRLGNTEPLRLLETLTNINNKYYFGRCVIVSSDGIRADWDKFDKKITLSQHFMLDLSSVFYHEAAHALWFYSTNEVLPDNYKDVITGIKNKIKLKPSGSTGKYLKEITEKYNEVYYEAGAEFDNVIKAQYGSISNYKEHLAQNIKIDMNMNQLEYHDYLKSIGFTDKEIDELGLLDIKDADKIASFKYQDEKIDYCHAIFQKKYPSMAAISDIIDAIFLGEFSKKSVIPQFGHGKDYYDKVGENCYVYQFHEIFAEYSLLRRLNDQEGLDILREIVGDELMTILEETYEQTHIVVSYPD